MSAGFGGTRRDERVTNVLRSNESTGFQRFSNAIVLDGLPLMPAPQTDPAKCPGETSSVSGSDSSFSWMLRYSSRRVLPRATRQIGTADGADEECVAREHEPRVRCRDGGL